MRIRDGEVQASQMELDSRIRELEQSWSALGEAVSEHLSNRFRAAALALRDAHLEYVSLYPHMSGTWNSAAWICSNGLVAIVDPRNASPIVNPADIQIESRWPPSAHLLAKSMNDLRAEIDAVK